MSKSLGTLVDARYRLRQRRLSKQKEIDELKEKEQELETEIFHALHDASVTSATGRVANVSIKKEQVPTLEDFDTFFAFAKRKGNQDLLARRVSRTAWLERIRAGKEVPGVKPFTRVSLSITKKR